MLLYAGEEEVLPVELKQNVCRICAKVFDNRAGLLQHSARSHSFHPFQYQCKRCESKFEALKSVKRHVKRCLIKTAHRCDQCGKSFAHPRGLKNHKFIHDYIEELPKPAEIEPRVRDGKNPFTCHICAKVCKVRQHLEDHLASHSSAEPFRCRVCESQLKKKSTFKTMHNAKIHVKLVHLKTQSH